MGEIKVDESELVKIRITLSTAEEFTKWRRREFFPIAGRFH